MLEIEGREQERSGMIIGIHECDCQSMGHEPVGPQALTAKSKYLLNAASRVKQKLNSKT